MSRNRKTAFTIMELLVVIGIISLLGAVLVPALSKAKRSALALVSANNQRQISLGVFSYSSDQHDRFPDSVAKMGKPTRWSWHEPTVLAGFQQQTPSTYRTVSAYLKDYLKTSSTLFCPSAPAKYPFAAQAWEAGDAWSNPVSNTGAEDPLFGNYCLYWNYVGYLEQTGRPFVGPQSNTSGRNESKLLISDYFGYGHWRNELAYNTRQAYGSCEKIPGASITPGTSVSCDFWSRNNSAGDITLDSLNVVLRAAFTDGHVETYTPADAAILKISIKPDGTIPYPDAVSPGGVFYIPQNSLP